MCSRNENAAASEAGVWECSGAPKTPLEIEGRFLFFIYFPSVSDRHGKNDQLVIYDKTNQSVVADPVAPLTRSIGGQAFAVGAGIVAADKVFHDP